MEENPYQSPFVEAAAPAPVQKEYNSIGGWLILVGIGIVVTPLKLLFAFATVHVPFITNGTLAALTNPAHPNYHPLFGPLFVFEILANGICLIWSIVNIVLFFGRWRIFPKVFIAFISVNLAIVILDQVFVEMIPQLAGKNDPNQMAALLRTIVGACIWIPYFLVSKRAKGTFTE